MEPTRSAQPVDSTSSGKSARNRVVATENNRNVLAAEDLEDMLTRYGSSPATKVQPYVEATLRSALAKELLDSLAKTAQNTGGVASAGPVSSASQRRNVKYMLTMGAIVGEFLKSTHNELTLSVFMKELEYYFTTNNLITNNNKSDLASSQSSSQISPVINELDRGMSLLGLIQLVSVAPFSKFGRQLQHSFYGLSSSSPVVSGEKTDKVPASRESSSFRSCTGTFLFQMLKSMETAGLFDTQIETDCQASIADFAESYSKPEPNNDGERSFNDVQSFAHNNNDFDAETRAFLAELDVNLSTSTRDKPVKNGGQNSGKNNKTHVLLKLKRLVQQQCDREMNVKLERIRGEELARIRRELDEHHRTEVLQSQLTLERDFKKRSAEVADLERKLTEQHAQRQAEFEHEEHIKRTKLLLEAENLAERGRDLERRYQVRRDELNKEDARLVALQADVQNRLEMTEGRERKLEHMQHSFEENLRERSQQYERELESQRKVADDEKRRLLQLTDESATRYNTLQRENEQLKQLLEHSKYLHSNGHKNADDADNVSLLRHELESTKAALKAETTARLNERQTTFPCNNNSSFNVDHSDTVEDVKRKLWQLSEHYNELKQRYASLTGKNVNNRNNSRQRESTLTSESDAPAPPTRRNDDFGHNKRQNKSNEQSKNREIANNNVNLATERLLNDLAAHLKAQDTLKKELTQEIDRGIQRLGAHAAATPVLMYPGAALQRDGGRPPPEPFMPPEAESHAVHSNHVSSATPVAPPHWNKPSKLAEFSSPSAPVPPSAAAVGVGGGRDGNVRMMMLIPDNTNVFNAHNTYSSSLNNTKNDFAFGDLLTTKTNSTADDADVSAQSLYEIRRLEKRLEQSMASRKKSRRIKSAKNFAKQQASSRSEHHSSAAAVNLMVPPSASEVRSLSPTISDAGYTRTVKTDSNPKPGLSTLTSLNSFSDIEFRHLTSQHNKMEEKIFRSVSPAPQPSAFNERMKHETSAVQHDETDRNHIATQPTLVDVEPVTSDNSFATPLVVGGVAGVSMPVKKFMPSNRDAPKRTASPSKVVTKSISNSGSEAEKDFINDDDADESYMNAIIQQKQRNVDQRSGGTKDAAEFANNGHRSNVNSRGPSPVPEVKNALQDDARPSADNDWFVKILQQQRLAQNENDNDAHSERQQNIPKTAVPNLSDALDVRVYDDKIKKDDSNLSTASSEESVPEDLEEEDAW